MRYILGNLTTLHTVQQAFQSSSSSCLEHEANGVATLETAVEALDTAVEVELDEVMTAEIINPDKQAPTSIINSALLGRADGAAVT